jgi:hypothetical protein
MILLTTTDESAGPPAFRIEHQQHHNRLTINNRRMVSLASVSDRLNRHPSRPSVPRYTKTPSGPAEGGSKHAFVPISFDQSPILYCNAPIHDDIKSAFLSAGSCIRIDYAKLHPDGPRPDTNCLLHDWSHLFRTPEDIDDVNALRDRRKVRETSTTQHLVKIGLTGKTVYPFPIKN